MITKQEFRFEDDGTVRLRNTFDYSSAINKAREYNETGAGYGKNGYMLGVIPEEMRLYDPWIQAAYRAKRAGDNAKYTDYMIRFFRVHSALAIHRRRVTWNGWHVPVIDKTPTPKRPSVLSELLEASP